MKFVVIAMGIVLIGIIVGTFNIPTNYKTVGDSIYKGDILIKDDKTMSDFMEIAHSEYSHINKINMSSDTISFDLRIEKGTQYADSFPWGEKKLIKSDGPDPRIFAAVYIPFYLFFCAMLLAMMHDHRNRVRRETNDQIYVVNGEKNGTQLNDNANASMEPLFFDFNKNNR